MHAVTRHSPLLGLMLLLFVPFGSARAVTAGVGVSAAGLLGEPAPGFSLPSLRAGHEPIQLADYRGKVVYLDFWSSWCAPCRRTMPSLDALRQEFSRQDFEVVGVNVDPVADDGRRFLDKVPVSYPIGADSSGLTAERFGVGVVPAVFVIDRGGVVRAAHLGDTAGAQTELRATVAKLIADGGVQ